MKLLIATFLFCIPFGINLAKAQLASLVIDTSNVLYNFNPSTGLRMRIIDPSQLKTNYTDSIGFGTIADSRVTVSNVKCVTCPPPQTGTLFHTISEGTVNGRTSMDSYNSGGAQGSILQGRRGRGLANSPSYALKDDILLAIGADGYGATAFHNISLGGVSVRAATDFSNQSSAPVYLVFTTTDSGTITPIQRAFLSMKGLWQWSAYGSGFIKSDASGNVTSSALSSADVTGALGYTPGMADSTLFQTKYRSDTGRSGAYTAINLASKSADSTIYQTKYRSDTGRANVYPALAGKFAIPTGTTGQYLRGDGTVANFPTLPDSATYQTKFRSDTGRVNAYTSLAGKQSTLSAGTGISIASNVVTNTAPDQTVSITAAGYGLTKTGTYPNFTLTQNTPSFNNAPSITLNSSSQISTTNNSRVSYTVSIAAAISIGQGIAYLEISANNSTWVTINSAGETSIALLNTKYYNLQGEVPAGYYRRVRTAVTGGGVITYMSGQEVTY